MADSIIINKQSKSFIESMSQSDKDKLYKAISKLVKFEGDIKKLKAMGKTKYSDKKVYRLKVEHYRIIFYTENGKTYVDYVDTRTNMKRRKCGYFSGC